VTTVALSKKSVLSVIFSFVVTAADYKKLLPIFSGTLQTNNVQICKLSSERFKVFTPVLLTSSAALN
jgi:hypothetical protein